MSSDFITETVDRSVDVGIAAGAAKVGRRILERLDPLVSAADPRDAALLQKVISIISDEVEALQEKRS